MKLIIKKENNGMYYAEMKWIEGVYAQWESIEEVIDNLWSVYNEVVDMLRDDLKERVKKLDFNKTIFKKVEFSL